MKYQPSKVKRISVLLISIILIFSFFGQTVLSVTMSSEGLASTTVTQSTAAESSAPSSTTADGDQSESSTTDSEQTTLPGGTDAEPSDPGQTASEETKPDASDSEQSTSDTSSKPSSTETDPSTTATEPIDDSALEQGMQLISLMSLMSFPWNATVSATDGLRLRSLPTTESTNLGTKADGVKLLVLGYVEGSSVYGITRWYAVITEPTGVLSEPLQPEGYMSARYVTLNPGVTVEQYIVAVDPPVDLPPPLSDSEFQAMLNRDFPVSYHAGLKELHKSYPYWTFTADNINHDWNYVISKQSPGKTSMVPISSKTSLKSYAADSYNYATNTWKNLDSGFTGASVDAIKYYMDPRNFFNSTYIFQFENQGYNPDFHTFAGIQNALKGSFMDPASGSPYVNNQGYIVYKDASGNTQTINKTYAQVFLEAAQNSGASPYFLIGRVIQEVGKTSPSASATGSHLTYPGIYNYYNIGAYSGTSPIANGLKYASSGTTYRRPWNNPEKAIIGGAEWIANGYINVGQDTLYYQKFDLVNFYHQYMTNIMAPTSESSIVRSDYYNIGAINLPFNFSIPVFKNMPASPTPKPSDNLCRNNWLKGITTAVALQPAFNPEVYSYTLKLTAPTNYISLIGVPYQTTSDVITKVNGSTVPGNNIPVPINASSPFVVTLTVCAEKRDVQRTYTITVQHQGADPSGIPPLQSSIYGFRNGVIDGLNPKKNQHLAENILRDLKFNTSGYQMRIKNSSGKVITSGIVSTGCTLEIIPTGQSTPAFIMPFIMYGDINGDGRINMIDATYMSEYYLMRMELNKAQMITADLNGDSRVNMIDATIISEYYLMRMEISKNK